MSFYFEQFNLLLQGPHPFFFLLKHKSQLGIRLAFPAPLFLTSDVENVFFFILKCQFLKLILFYFLL